LNCKLHHGRKTAIDPVTFEILRHRFATLVEEGALVLKNVSGSPSVAHSHDCNVALLTREGEGVVIGPNIVSHALSCMHTARYVLQEYRENPGINRGDMFLSNHPYISTPHQTCVALVAPIHREGSIVAWSGAGIHVADVGGPVPGQVAVGAQSIWEEPQPIPPIKIVEGGVLRKDIEQEYLIRSRTRIQNAIDLRAKIAANNTINDRILGLIDRYGVETVMEAGEEVIRFSEQRLRAVLRMVPDGSWSHTTYLDYYDRGHMDLYLCRLKLTKRGEELIFDFRGSSPQAPAVINATYTALQSSVVRMVMAIFGYTIGLCPGAVLRSIRIEADPGTVVNCSWPAGVCKGTTSATYSIMAASAACLSKMLASSHQTAGRTVAPFKGHMHMMELMGKDQRDHIFGTVFVDGSLAQGNGAMSVKDGIDTGGGMDPAVGIPNVETNEFRYPLLYLYRRQQPDTGGPGKYRGGVGLAAAFVPHGVKGIPNVTFHGHGFTCPTASGLYGGSYGGMNRVVVKRRSDILKLFAEGRLPSDIDEISGDAETPELVSRSSMQADDVYHGISCGGGGYGDPIEREPGMVLEDVRQGLVSRQWAEKIYGVVMGPSLESVDGKATGERRGAIREERKRRSSPAPGEPRVGPASSGEEREAPTSTTMALSVVSLIDGDYTRCHCGQVLCGVEEDYTGVCPRWDRPCEETGPYLSSPGFQLREYYCPGCYSVLEVELVQKETHDSG